MTTYFKQWLATKERCNDLPGTLAIDPEGVAQSGYTYDGSFIEDHANGFFLLIERMDWTFPVEQLPQFEEVLWALHACYEFGTPGNAASEGINGEDLDVFVRGICLAWGWRVDGDAFGLAFSHVNGDEGSARVTPGDAADIIAKTVHTYQLDKPEPAPDTRHEYAFDVKLFASIRVKAESEEQARAIYRECLNGAEANFGAWPDGDPILGQCGLDEPENDELIEVDGEAV